MSAPLRVPLMIVALTDLNVDRSVLRSDTAVAMLWSAAARSAWIASDPLLSPITTCRAASTAFEASERFDGCAE